MIITSARGSAISGSSSTVGQMPLPDPWDGPAPSQVPMIRTKKQTIEMITSPAAVNARVR